MLHFHGAYQPLEHRQVLGPQRQVGAEVIDAAERVGIGHIDRKKRDLASADGSGQIDEHRQLPVVGALQGDSDTRRDPVARRRPDPLQDLVEGIETPYRSISLAIRSIQRHRNGVEQRAGAMRMLGQR